MKLTQFLARWNIDCYKDEDNNFYIKHDDYSNYLGGQFIDCENMNEIIETLPDGLLEDDMNDIEDNLGKYIRKETGIDINTSDAEIMVESLEKAYEIGDSNLKSTIEASLDIMKIWTDANKNLVDDVKDTSLEVAVLKAIENGSIRIDYSYYFHMIVAKFGEDELGFSPYIAKTWDELVTKTLDNDTKNDLYLNYSDYGDNEAAVQIANRVVSVCNIDLQERCLEYLKDHVSDFYTDAIEEQIEKVKSDNRYWDIER